jgi:pimeloyl-ACP methyl ester carboxylesterase
VLTIAHGTTGLADACAPSTDLPPSRAFPPNELALIAPAPPVEPWLLVQTDYEGLGTPGRHPYLVGESEGRAVIDAARAATQLPGADASRSIAIAGYSQGGHAALWAGEVASSWAPELEVIGVFSGAPGADLDWSLITTADTQDLPTRRAILLATIAGHHAAYPDTDPTTVLTELGQQRLELLDELCVAEFVAAVANDDPRAMLRPEGIGVWAEILSRSNAGQHRIAAPVLIIYGDEDTAFPLPAREAMIDRMCGIEGNVIERRVISGSHNSASRPAFAAGIAWLNQRAAGQDPTDECPQRQAATTAEHEE